MSKEDEPKSCSICLEPNDDLLIMPCCGSDSSSIRYCKPCIRALCVMDTSNKDTTGVCPICKKLFQIEFRITSLKRAETRGRCRMCCQGNKVIVSRDELCENCLLGQSHPFRYECDRCGGEQEIPHPMWRYQNTAVEFGSATWACHVRCGDYTHWRILSEDVGRVPASLIPESWESGEEVDAEAALAQVRDRIQREGGQWEFEEYMMLWSMLFLHMIVACI